MWLGFPAHDGWIFGEWYAKYVNNFVFITKLFIHMSLITSL